MEHLEVLRQVGLAEPGLGHQLADAPLVRAQRLEDAEPGGLRQRLETIGDELDLAGRQRPAWHGFLRDSPRLRARFTLASRPAGELAAISDYMPI
jgi:hypothetical protein